jgi:hypothetical protein
MKINNFNADERPSSLTDKFLSWSGISDGVESVSAARAGDYASMGLCCTIPFKQHSCLASA